MKTQYSKNEAANEQDASDRYLRLPKVLALTGVSWRTLLRWERSGDFPKRYKIGPRIVAWKESEVLQWFAERAIAATSKRGSL